MALFASLVASLTPRQQYLVGILGLHDTVEEAAEALGLRLEALAERLQAISVRLSLRGQEELVDLARRHAILDAVPHGLYGVDADGICVFANAAAAELCVEITETLLVEDAEPLRQLKQLGIQIAVDDFGTGYSSLLHLRRFPVDIVKMDRTFVAGITRDEQDRTIVESTIGLAHALGHQTVAEGVEEVEQLEMLRALGCGLAQGFLWSPPVEPASIVRFLREDVVPTGTR